MIYSKGPLHLTVVSQPPSPFAEPESPPASHVIITASFGHILPKRILELFLPSRRLNVHPSLLPEYRGAAPIQHTIMDGLKDTGVSVVEMLERSKGIDAGALWGQERVVSLDVMRRLYGLTSVYRLYLKE